MSQHESNTTVTSFDGIDGDLQLVIAPSRSGGANIVLVDCQAAERGCDGVLRNTHSSVRLPFSSARALADFIRHLDPNADGIDERSDPRQPCLWSPSVLVEPIRPPARARRRRLAAALAVALALFVGGPAFAGDPPPPSRDADLIGAMAQQQQATAGMMAVLVQMLMTQQEILHELQEIRVAQPGAQK